VISCQSGGPMSRSLRRTLAIHSAANQCSTLNVVPVQGIILLSFFRFSIYVYVKELNLNIDWISKAT
jgi:hypothetical protein